MGRTIGNAVAIETVHGVIRVHGLHFALLLGLWATTESTIAYGRFTNLRVNCIDVMH